MSFKYLVLLLLFASSVFANLDIISYYGKGCPHCARVDVLLEELDSEYELNIVQKEIYYDAQNRQEMFDVYASFGLDPGESGVPTILLDNRSLLIGEMSEQRFKEIFDEHIADDSVSGIYTAKSSSPIEEKDSTATLTLWVLLGAAVADSVNPCTIAVMAMLLGVIMKSGDKRMVLYASIIFISIIFTMYYLMGLGLLYTITNTELTNIFFTFVTIATLALAILEIRAYIDYKPGFLSVEIPMFLRPFMKGVIRKAVTLSAVALAALVCSLILLPCSSGPYLVVLGMLAKSVTLQGLSYLFIYNFVFILPMIVVASMIYFGKASVDDIGEFREKHIRSFHLIAGMLFFILFLMMLNQMLGIVEL